MGPSIQEVQADRALQRVAQNVTYSLTALNYRAERSLFLANKKANPAFKYARHNPLLLKQAKTLPKVKIPKSVVGELLREKVRELEDRIIFATTRENALATKASERLYGVPTRKTSTQARNVVDAAVRTHAKIDAHNIPDHEILKALKVALQRYGLSKWKPIASHEPSQGLAIAPGKRIHVQKGITDSLEEIPMIITHEVETHVLCEENAARSPLYLFRKGLAGWSRTQEGLAAYNVLTQFKKQSVRPLFHWATRVLAVEKALRGSFRDVFELLRQLGLNEEYAFATAYKTKVGIPAVDLPGANTRPHIYFSGLHDVQRHVANGGTVEQLYIGRITIEALPRLKKIGWIKPPLFLPRFLA